jgi:oligopeptide/dipeptide ABC transporter ATP-binding protein
MRVADIVGEPLLVHAPAMSKGERSATVIEMLERVGLDASYKDRFPHQVSGGQAQRVAIARALILEPKILICDEAVAALDGSAREKVLRLLQKVQAETGLSIIFISHDLAVVRSISHRVAVMYMGRLVEVAGGDALFDSPKHPYTRALIDAIPVPDPRVPPKGAPLRGEVPSLLNPPSGCVFHPRCRFAEEDCGRTRPELREVSGSRVACLRAEEIEL